MPNSLVAWANASFTSGTRPAAPSSRIIERSSVSVCAGDLSPSEPRVRASAISVSPAAEPSASRSPFDTGAVPPSIIPRASANAASTTAEQLVPRLRLLDRRQPVLTLRCTASPFFGAAAAGRCAAAGGPATTSRVCPSNQVQTGSFVLLDGSGRSRRSPPPRGRPLVLVATSCRPMSIRLPAWCRCPSRRARRPSASPSTRPGRP